MEIRKTLIVERLRLFRRRRDGVVRRTYASPYRQRALCDLQQRRRRGRRRMRMRRLSKRQQDRQKSHARPGYFFRAAFAGAVEREQTECGRRKRSSQTEQRSERRTNGAEVRRAPPESGADDGNRPPIRVAVDLTDSYPWPISAIRWACFAGPRVEPSWPLHNALPPMPLACSASV